MKLPRVAHNRPSYVGAGIAVLALAAFLFLVVFHTVTQTVRAPYAGIVIFILVPAVLLSGLALILVGMALEYRRLRRDPSRSVPRLPVIDLNNPRHRNATLISVVASVVLLFLSAFGSYEAYQHTESVEFCGTLCHGVMKPEYTTYLHSPHQRVACVDCHVGPGADWFVKSKVSGLGQVVAVLTRTYPRPIPTPIESLRPSRETCEQCHWPGQAFGGMQRRRVHFLNDEQNTRWEIELLLKVGGAHSVGAAMEGIHWHVNVAHRVEYIAADDRRQVIPWVRTTNRLTGTVTTYVTAADVLPPGALAGKQPRVMDCIDCHNRPTHVFQSPAQALNEALAIGRIDATLPSIKRTGVELLTARYDSTADALGGIERGVRAFYGDQRAEVARAKADAIEQAATALREIYLRNFFPEMKARWDAYPDNAGHVRFPGCARCHDGRHRSDDGRRTITSECTACHTIRAQGTPPNLVFASGPQGLRFQHPVDVGDIAQEPTCSACHAATAP